ncbi:hypothetical protein Theam_1768 (plasmid) [Thermovibrio ammonificans HB-1]|uniref:Uncharacterized protein n=1 Tax=Thermovibrio ammonificans (strain DSM 15698 / JCM 12110 / HB-1) TaxID=648996 RepID=E8T703_THEA1|nr:hypothetical protein [Thermovibrio ammonificans]ADU97724.1 hypothetical protein Theam_1768 [Thermovibrio ammonificans HB-1]
MIYLDFGEKVFLAPVFAGMEHPYDVLEGRQFLIKGASDLIVVFYPERATCDSPWECQPAEVFNTVWKAPVLQGSTEDIVEYLEPIYPLTPARITPLTEPLPEVEVKDLERKRLNRVKNWLRFMRKVKKENPDWLVFPLTLSTLRLNYNEFRRLKRDYAYFIGLDEDTIEEMARSSEVSLVSCAISSLKEGLIRNGFEELVQTFIPSPEELDSYSTAVFLQGNRAQDPVYRKVSLEGIRKELKKELQEVENDHQD